MSVFKSNLKKMKIARDDKTSLLSTERSVLMGIAILWLALFHSSLNFSRFPVLGMLADHGNIGVDIFLFLSGIGSYYSYCSIAERGAGRVLTYYRKRFLRIMPCTVICLTLWYLYEITVSGPSSPFRFILDITSLGYWFYGSNPGWYISLTIVLYLAYPLLFKIIEKDEKGLLKRALLIIAAVIGFNSIICLLFPSYFYKVELALGRIPVFIAGCFIAPAVKKETRLSKRQLVLCGIIACMGGFVLVRYGSSLKAYAIWRYLYGITAICLTVLLSVVTQFNHDLLVTRILVFFGQYTLEIYLTHVLFLRVLTRHLQPIIGSVRVTNILAFAASVIISVFLKEILHSVLELLERKQDNS